MRDPWMYVGGCGALAACDVCISLSLSHGLPLYPYGKESLNRRDYRRFALEMKPFLKPRMKGINTTALFIEGFGRYLREKGLGGMLSFTEVSGERSLAEAEDCIYEQIRQGIPVPYLNLRHRNPAFRDYVWHWFMLTGINEKGQVLAATYGEEKWLDLKALWDTGYRQKGGFVICTPKS